MRLAKGAVKEGDEIPNLLMLHQAYLFQKRILSRCPFELSSSNEISAKQNPMNIQYLLADKVDPIILDSECQQSNPKSSATKVETQNLWH